MAHMPGFVGRVPITFWILLPMIHQDLAHSFSTVLLGYTRQNCSGPKCSSGHSAEGLGNAAVLTLFCFCRHVSAHGCFHLIVKGCLWKILNTEYHKETLLDQPNETKELGPCWNRRIVVAYALTSWEGHCHMNLTHAGVPVKTTHWGCLKP